MLIVCWITSVVAPLYGKMLVKFECWNVGGPQLLAKYGGYAVAGKALENDVPHEWARPEKTRNISLVLINLSSIIHF